MKEEPPPANHHYLHQQQNDERQKQQHLRPQEAATMSTRKSMHQIRYWTSRSGRKWLSWALALTGITWIIGGRKLPTYGTSDQEGKMMSASCPPCKTATAQLPVHQQHEKEDCNIFNDPVVKDLRIFQASSKNDATHKHLWFLGAKTYIPYLNELLGAVGYEMKTETCDDYDNQGEFTQRLAALFNQYGSDKSSMHDYHKLYGNLLSPLEEKPLNLLEIGMGTNNSAVVSSMGVHGKPGASLRAFRDALPNANVYGADIDADILFTEDRIKTVQVDQTDRKSFASLELQEEKYHLIIDDGLHSIGANFNTMLWAMEHVEEGGYIVIEDIGSLKPWEAIDFILAANKTWEKHMLKCRAGDVFLLRKIGASQ